MDVLPSNCELDECLWSNESACVLLPVLKHRVISHFSWINASHTVLFSIIYILLQYIIYWYLELAFILYFSFHFSLSLLLLLLAYKVYLNFMCYCILKIFLFCFVYFSFSHLFHTDQQKNWICYIMHARPDGDVTLYKNTALSHFSINWTRNTHDVTVFTNLCFL